MIAVVNMLMRVIELIISVVATPVYDLRRALLAVDR